MAKSVKSLWTSLSRVSTAAKRGDELQREERGEQVGLHMESHEPTENQSIGWSLWDPLQMDGY